MITDLQSTNTKLKGITGEVNEDIEVIKDLMCSIRILLTTEKVSQCVICDSTMHWKNDCPCFQMFTEELMQECYLDTVVGETCCSALLDSGCTETVSGTEWLREYTLGLSEEDRKTIVRSKSDRIFMFGDGKVVNAYERATIPATIGSQKGVIE